MTRSVEIFFNDLNDSGKEKYLKAAGVSDSSELNHEVEPIAICDFEVEDDNNLNEQEA